MRENSSVDAHEMANVPNETQSIHYVHEFVQLGPARFVIISAILIESSHQSPPRLPFLPIRLPRFACLIFPPKKSCCYHCLFIRKGAGSEIACGHGEQCMMNA